MRLLIIGCTGFLGRKTSEVGARNGHEILGIGRSSRPPEWCGEYLQERVLSDLDEIIRDYAPAVIVHAAGRASVRSSFDTPFTDLQACILTWGNTLESVRRSGIKPLVLFPSSAAVYGNPRKLPVSEDETLAPISPYGFHKAACELLAREYSKCFGLEIMVCRFFSLFGESLHRLLVWELYQQLTGACSKVCLEGTGTESRDYLEVSDAMAAVFQLIDRRREAMSDKLYTRGQTQVVNIGRGEETNVLDLAEQLRNLVAPDKRISCRGLERMGDPWRWRADITRLRSLAPNWRPNPLSFSLSQCVAAWRKPHDVP